MLLTKKKNEKDKSQDVPFVCITYRAPRGGGPLGGAPLAVDAPLLMEEKDIDVVILKTKKRC